MAATVLVEGKGLLEPTEASTLEQGEEPRNYTPVFEGTVYVVQVLEEHEVELEKQDPDDVVDAEVVELWRDIATVTVPKRAHRKRAVELALEQPENAHLRPSREVRHSFRALGPDAAEPLSPTVKTVEQMVWS